MKRLLITRDESRSENIANFLRKNGFEVYFEPLLEIENLKIDFAKSDFSKISAIILTSANACKAIIDAGFDKNIKIFSVGKKTSEKLIKAGFKNIHEPKNSSAADLLNLIIEKGEKNESLEMIYFCGQIVSLDFKKELKKYGFRLKEVLSYKTKSIKNFSSKILQNKKNFSFDYVLIYSQNSAETFYKAAKSDNLIEYFSSSKILCFSEKILQKVKELGFKNSETFDENQIIKNFYEW